MLTTARHFIPLAALVTLAAMMAFVPKIGPVLLAGAVIATVLLSLKEASQAGWRRVPSECGAAITDSGAAKKPLIVILLFMALCALSLLWVPDANFALSRTIRLLGFFLAFAIYGLIFARAGAAGRRLTGPMAHLALAGFLVAAVCMVLSFTLIAPGMAHPDSFTNRSVVVLALSGFAFAAYIRASGWPALVKNGLTALLAGVALGFSMFSNSQTSSVAFLSGMIAVVAFQVANARFRKIFVIAIAGLCFAMPLLVKAVTLLPEPVFATAFFQQGSAGQRLLIWDSYLALVREKPLLGWGIEGSRDFDAALLSTPVAAGQNVLFTSHPHNAPLQIWTDLGLVGALLFSILIALLGMRIEKARPEARAAIYGLFAAILATSAVSHGAFQSWWLASIAILAVSVFPLADPKADYS